MDCDAVVTGERSFHAPIAGRTGAPRKEGGQGVRSGSAPQPGLASRWARAREVLAVRLDNVGDVLMCGPALRAIRDNLPEARLTLWASPSGSRAAALLPVVDAVLSTKVVWQDLGSLPPDPAREQALVAELRGRRFDAALIFTSFAQSPYPPAYLCYLAEIPLRAGQSKEFGGSLLTTWVRPLPDEVHQVDRNLHLLESLGFAVTGRDLAVAVPAEARESAARILDGHGVAAGEQYVVLHPAASCSARTYARSRFAEVGRALVRRTGLRLILSGSAQERELSDWLAERIGRASVSLAGETTLPEFAAVVGGAALVIANNTSIMHIADALRVPSVVLFAGTELESQWRPRGAPARLLRRDTRCAPCYRFVCPFRQECLDVRPDEVVRAAEELLSEGGRHACTFDARQPLEADS